jgi:hypothetical protein
MLLPFSGVFACQTKPNGRFFGDSNRAPDGIRAPIFVNPGAGVEGFL